MKPTAMVYRAPPVFQLDTPHPGTGPRDRPPWPISSTAASIALLTAASFVSFTGELNLVGNRC